jgi:hypothetical protein
VKVNWKIGIVIGFPCNALTLSGLESNLPMAGLEPARAFYVPTDLKSVSLTRD